MYDWRRMSQAEREAAVANRKGARLPWHGPPHDFRDEGTFHLSAACFEHAPFIGTSVERMAACEAELVETLGTCCETVYAWCVLPNHYHTLVETLNLKGTTTALGEFHGRTSYRWNGEEGTRGRTVWHRCADRGIRSERHFWTTMNYVHHNPVHHGYTADWEAWPFSSARDFIEAVGRREAVRIWRVYPIRDYGKGWDDASL